MANKGIKAVLLLVIAFFISAALFRLVRIKHVVPGKTGLEYTQLVPEIMEMIQQKYVEPVD